MTLNSNAKFDQTLTLSLQKRHEELDELSLGHSINEKFYIDGPFLSKACYVPARKFQRNYVLLQNLKKN